MNPNSDIHQLIEEVLAESRLPARKREELRKELESHMWEMASELREHGLERGEIRSTIQDRFGVPKEIGRAFSFIYGGFLMRLLKPGLIVLGALLLVFLVWPWHSLNTSGKYYTFLHEKFGDEAWYEGAVASAAAKAQGVEAQDAECRHQERMEHIPFGSIITRCHQRWLMLKMLPPILLSGPRVSPPDVIAAMREAKALRNYHAVFGADPLNAVAARALEAYLESLALGAGRTKTQEAVSPGRPFVSGTEIGLGSDDGLSLEERTEMMRRGFMEMRGFPTASLYWAEDTEQLREWNPDVAPDDLHKLLAAACARQIQCLMPVKIEVVSAEKETDSAVVTLRAFLDSSDKRIANHPFLFEVTRFDLGTKNDWTDDEYNVTKGFAYLP